MHSNRPLQQRPAPPQPPTQAAPGLQVQPPQPPTQAAPVRQPSPAPAAATALDPCPESGARTALARLQEIEDPEFDNLRLASLGILEHCRDKGKGKGSGKGLPHLRDTLALEDWRVPLDALGCDQQNVMSLVLLAQQGLPGRAEANNLLWLWMTPTSLESLCYINAPLVYQAAIRNARKKVDRPPDEHRDYTLWTPHATLVGTWERLSMYAPRDAHRNIVAPPPGSWRPGPGKGKADNDKGKGKTDPGKGKDTGKGKADNDTGKGKADPGKGTGNDKGKGKDMTDPGGPMTSDPLSLWNGVEWTSGWWHDYDNGLWKMWY